MGRNLAILFFLRCLFTGALIGLLAVVCFASPQSGYASEASNIELVLQRKLPKIPGDISSPDNPLSLSDADLVIGKHQVDQMLNDRKEMTAFVHSGDPIYLWVVRQMAGGAVGKPILWNADTRNIPPGIFACHTSPYGFKLGTISIRERYPDGMQVDSILSGNQMWAALVFEIFNISHTKQFLSIYNQTYSNFLSKSLYIEKMTRIEYSSVQGNVQFYRETWQPWCEAKRLNAYREVWFVDAPDTYEKWISGYREPDPYISSYTKYYDEQIEPCIQSITANDPSI